MTPLRRLFGRIATLLDVIDASVSASAAVRMHRSPEARDLRRLGIDPASPAVAAMGRY